MVRVASCGNSVVRRHNSMVRVASCGKGGDCTVRAAVL